MTPEELEDLAFEGKPLPNGIKSQAEVLLFLSFRNLYDFAKRCRMAPEQGQREKAEILHSFRINKFLEDIQESTNQMWKDIEAATAEYNKSPSVEAADKVVKALYKADRMKDHET